MKQATSIGIPTFCEISMIGTMSAATVRAAQLGRSFIRGIRDLARQPRDRSYDVRPRSRQADVCGIDAEGLDQVEDLEFLLDGRALDRGGLQAVAERLVVQLDLPPGRGDRPSDSVPVVDQVGFRRMHGHLP